MRALILPALVVSCFFGSAPASACQSGVQTYVGSGTSATGQRYTAVRVDWDMRRIEVKTGVGWETLNSFTPANPDPRLFEMVAEQTIGRQVSAEC